MSASNGRKTVTIRGLSLELYERISRLAREMGLTIGELVNEALKRYIETLENVSRVIDSLIKSGNVIVVSGVSHLEVSKSDLELADKPIVFKDINELVFGDDVTNDLIREKVAKIINVDVVYVPKTISTVLVASKCEFVRKITPKT